MSLLPPEDLLRHIFDEATYLIGASADLTESAFRGDETLRRAFTRSLEIIGEASKKIDPAFRARHPQVDWRGMTGTRDKLIHGYFGVDYELVWEIVARKIPPLRAQIEAILESL